MMAFMVPRVLSIYFDELYVLISSQAKRELAKQIKPSKSRAKRNI